MTAETVARVDAYAMTSEMAGRRGGKIVSFSEPENKQAESTRLILKISGLKKTALQSPTKSSCLDVHPSGFLHRALAEYECQLFELES